MLKFIVRRHLLDDPGAPGRHLPDVHDDAADRRATRSATRSARCPPAVQANLERKFHLDEPWYKQYAYYVKGVFTLDFGPSLVLRGRRRERHRQGALPEVDRARRLRVPLRDLVGVPLGMIAALKQNTWVDYTAMFFSNIFHAVPSFLLATLLIYFIALKGGRVTDERLVDRGSTRSCRRSRSDSRRWRSSPGSCAERCSRRCSRTTSGPRGQGPSLPARRRAARAAQLADPGDHGGRPAARLHHHGLVRDRADLQHPRHRRLLRHRGERARLLGRDGPDRPALRDHHHRQPRRRHPLRHPRSRARGTRAPDGRATPPTSATKGSSSRALWPRPVGRSARRTSGRTPGVATCGTGER